MGNRGRAVEREAGLSGRVAASSLLHHAYGDGVREFNRPRDRAGLPEEVRWTGLKWKTKETC